MAAIFQSALKTRVKSHKIRIKRPKIVCGWGSAPQTLLTTLPQTLKSSGDRINSRHFLDRQFTSNAKLCMVPEKKTFFGSPLY